MSKVSIITPLYNSKTYIERTIQSVFNQTYTEWELIIIDDCSTDNSLQIVENYSKNDSRIRILRNSENSGAAQSRNNGIKAAKGKYIAFLDSDDQWYPNKLETQIKFMSDLNISFSYSYYNQINDYGSEVGIINNLPLTVDYKSTLKSNKIGCLTAVYDAEKLGKVYMSDIKKRQDYTLWLAILKKTQYAYCVPDVLATYTIRKGSISSNRLSLIKYHWHIYRVIESQSVIMSSYYLMYWIISKVFGGGSR